MATIKFTVYATTLTAALGFAGCKPAAAPTQSTSETKSLDNFASDGQSFTFNSCSGNEAVKATEAALIGSQSEKTAMRSALTAVPADLQTAFFGTLRGSIQVTDNIAGQCGTNSNASVDATLSCWKAGDQNVVIYIKSEGDAAKTERNIKHSIVRAFGYILTDVILKVQSSPEGTRVAANPHLEQTKAELATAFLADIQANKKYKLPQSILADRRALEDGTFAESFDSWFCSSTSRQKMQTDFPKTAGLFSEIASAVSAGLVSAPEKDEGFGLWGRWGAGNGPLRQGFSNWASFRAEGGGLMNFRRFADGGGLVFQRPWFNPWRWGNN